MSFDEVSFPLAIKSGAMTGPTFSTEIVATSGGYERRNQNWSQARRKFDARASVLSQADYAALTAFFMARAGRARGFRLKDWSDFTSAADGISTPLWSDQRVGTGDGATTAFQLIKTYGSGGGAHVRPIRKPVSGSATMGVGGAQAIGGWSLDATTGVVTFVSPPANGAAVTAGFIFDVPARFDADQLSVMTGGEKSSRQEIPIVEVRV